MRYLGFEHEGDDCIGVVTGDQVSRLATIAEFYGDVDRWRGSEPAGPSVPLESITARPPVPPTAKVLCLGLNYQAHIQETGSERPPAPNIFAR